MYYKILIIIFGSNLYIILLFIKNTENIFDLLKSYNLADFEIYVLTIIYNVSQRKLML